MEKVAFQKSGIQVSTTQNIIRLTRKSPWTLAGEGSDGIDRPEQHRVTPDEARRVTELEHREALLEVEAWLVDADVVVEWQHLGLKNYYTKTLPSV